jgi:hypothetical protein
MPRRHAQAVSVHEHDGQLCIRRPHLTDRQRNTVVRRDDTASIGVHQIEILGRQRILVGSKRRLPHHYRKTLQQSQHGLLRRLP